MLPAGGKILITLTQFTDCDSACSIFDRDGNVKLEFVTMRSGNTLAQSPAVPRPADDGMLMSEDIDGRAQDNDGRR